MWNRMLNLRPVMILVLPLFLLKDPQYQFKYIHFLSSSDFLFYDVYLNSKLKMPCTSSVPFCILAATMRHPVYYHYISMNWFNSCHSYNILSHFGSGKSLKCAWFNNWTIGLIHSTLRCLIVHAWVIGYCSCLIGIPSTNMQNTVSTLSHALVNICCACRVQDSNDGEKC